MPTILELAGAPIPENIDGSSLLHALSRTWLHGEHTLGELSSQFILTKEDKYIWYSQTGEEQYFDLKTDPHETHNAIHEDAYHKRIKHLRCLLTEALRDSEEGYVCNGELIVGKTPQTVLRR